MIRQFTVLLCGLALSLGSQAAELTPEQALQRLGVEALPQSATRGGFTRTPVYTEIAPDGLAAIYVFENSNQNGYLLVSADDVAAPLLGYADSGSFKAEDMPEQMKWWLGEYARQIEYARTAEMASYTVTRSDSRSSVAPLLKTKWNQGAPYNNLLPVVNGKHCVTGCVATAVAQVMKYWNYPEKGSGTVTITNPSTQAKENLDLSLQTFEWNQMLDTYNAGKFTDAQANAVAYLMKAVGYAGDMSYGTDESSAYAYKAGQSLVNNFGYNPNLQYCDRTYFQAADWEDMIYEELAAGRPVLYGGQSTSGGHQFVCDGYSGDGYFHFNWGWGGMSDGYFLLNSLNPDAVGIGGGLGGGFNYLQEVTVGIQPKDKGGDVDVANLVQYGALKVTDSGLKLNISVVRDNGAVTKWMNTGFTDLSMIVGVAIEPENGGATPQYFEIAKGTVKKPELIEDAEGFGMSLYGLEGKGTVSLPSSLADGTYKATIVCKQQNGGKWHPMLTLPQYYNFFYFTKSGNKITNLNVFSEASVVLDDIELLTPLYYNCMVKIRIKATNNSEKDMTKGFYPDLYKGSVCQMMGDGIVLTIPPKTTVTEEFITEFRLLNGVSAPVDDTQYTLKVSDPNDETFYNKTKDVTMQLSAGTPDFSVTSFEIPDADTKIEKFNNRLVDVYQIEGSEVKFDINISNKGPFFGYPVIVAVFEEGNSYAIAQQQFGPVCVLGAYESANLTASVDATDLATEKVYMSVLFYYPGSNPEQIPSVSYKYFKKVDGSGVGEISADHDGPVKYYNMQGQEVDNPAKGMLLIRKQGSKTEKIIY